jgi:hypothetical protein
MHVDRSEPVAKWLVRFTVGEKGVEVLPDLLVDLFFRCRDRFACSDHASDVLGELIELTSRGFVGVLLATVGRVDGLAGALDFVAFAQVIASVTQQQRKGGDCGSERDTCVSSPIICKGEEDIWAVRCGGGGGGGSPTEARRENGESQ